MSKKEKDIIRFSGRNHSKLGIVSTIIGAVDVIGLIAISIFSSTSHGKGGTIVGIVGLLLFVIAAAGFAISYKSLKEKDIYYRFPVIGSTINGLMLMLLLIIYLLGM